MATSLDWALNGPLVNLTIRARSSFQACTTALWSSFCSWIVTVRSAAWSPFRTWSSHW